MEYSTDLAAHLFFSFVCVHATDCVTSPMGWKVQQFIVEKYQLMTDPGSSCARIL